jgi:hypothetical protein
MKHLFLIISLCLFAHLSFAQNQKKVLFGSFVFENQVFQYQYKRDGNIHSLKLSTLAQPNPMADLNDEKLKKTEAFLTTAVTVENSKKFKNSSEYLKNASDSTLKLISVVPNYIKELKNIKTNKNLWKEHYKNIDQLLEIFDKYKIENLKVVGDTLIKDIYSVTELLSMYKSFLQNVAEPQTTQEIPFSELKQDEFQLIFKQELGQLYFNKNKSFQELNTKATEKAIDVMYEIKARVDFKDDEPITAYVNLKRKFINIDFDLNDKKTKKDTIIRIKAYQNNKRDTTLKNLVDTAMKLSIRFEVKNVVIEFEDGGIKNIFADLQPLVPEYERIYGNSTIRFRNNKPISITGKFDPDFFNEQRIFAGNTLELVNNLFEEAKRQKPNLIIEKKDFLNSSSVYASFKLSNLIDYRVVSETDNEDYSPTNSKIELSEPHALVELKKEKRSKILSAKAYTDFMGLSDDQPNGLVQIEVSKRINFLTGKKQGLWGIGGGNQRGLYSGGLTYFEPKFTISKIEENNRYLKLDSNHLDKTKSLNDSTNHFLVNPLEVLRYQQWSFGLDFNLLKINMHNRKSNFQLNGNFTYGRTSTADSIKISQSKITQIQSQNISKISTTSWGLSLMYEVKPDSRYGFSFGYDFRWMDMVSTQFEYNSMFSNQFHSAWFNGFFKVSDDSKMFWRFRKNWLTNNSKYNFYQIQLGYELDIFKAAK